MFRNIKESYAHIPYTFKHYLAFMKLEKELIGSYKYKFHDVDKLFMYFFLPFLGTDKIKVIHKKINRHHITNDKSFDKCNYDEAIIDWECARFTKPDKPENAREVTEKKFVNSKHFTKLKEQLIKFNL